MTDDELRAWHKERRHVVQALEQESLDPPEEIPDSPYLRDLELSDGEGSASDEDEEADLLQHLPVVSAPQELPRYLLPTDYARDIFSNPGRRESGRDRAQLTLYTEGLGFGPWNPPPLKVRYVMAYLGGKQFGDYAASSPLNRSVAFPKDSIMGNKKTSSPSSLAGAKLKTGDASDNNGAWQGGVDLAGDPSSNEGVYLRIRLDAPMLARFRTDFEAFREGHIGQEESAQAPVDTLTFTAARSGDSESEEAPASARFDYPLKTNLWATETGIAFLWYGVPTVINFVDSLPAEGKLEASEVTSTRKQWTDFGSLLNARNLRLDYIRPAVHELGYWITESDSSGKTKGRSKSAITRLAPRSSPLPAELLFPSNNVHAASVYALSSPDSWQPAPVAGIARGVTRNYKHLEITVGLPDSPQAQSLWEYIASGGPRMVKAHYALSARWYEDGGEATGFTTIHINQFCADLGYSKHHKGGFRLRDKQQSVKILEALTSVELRAVFTKPGSKPGVDRQVRLRGALWARGIVAEERDVFTDLFGQAREGSPSEWEPGSFSFGPGPFFSDATWRQHNKSVGKIGVGLMQLDNRNDEWAILIGGYLGTIMRAEQYAPKRLKVGTILRQINRAQEPDAMRRRQENLDKLETALDRLVEVNILSSWTFPDVDTAEISDANDPQAIADYYEQDPLPQGDWRAQIVEVMPPLERESDAERLRQAQNKAIKSASEAKAKREKNLLPFPDSKN